MYKSSINEKATTTTTTMSDYYSQQQQDQRVGHSRQPSSSLGGSSSSNIAVAEMTEGQFRASLDALMCGGGGVGTSAGACCGEGGPGSSNATPSPPLDCGSSSPDLTILPSGMMHSSGATADPTAGMAAAAALGGTSSSTSSRTDACGKSNINGGNDASSASVHTLPGGAMQVTGMVGGPPFSMPPEFAMAAQYDAFGTGTVLLPVPQAAATASTGVDASTTAAAATEAAKHHHGGQHVSFALPLAPPPAPPSTECGSVVSSTTGGGGGGSTTSGGGGGGGGRRGRKRTAAVSEDEASERARRRYDRNQREQQRSQQITNQIGHLRDILTEANVQFKPDKYSTLVTVGEYVRQLQQRSAVLDAEHRKLLDTIRKTSEVVNSHHGPTPTCVSSSSTAVSDGKLPAAPAAVASSAATLGASAPSSPQPQQQQAPFVSGLDYKALFLSCPVACAIASIDGRFLDCNREFEDLTGFTRAELLPHTLTASADVVPVPVTSSSSASGSDGASPDAGRAGRNLSLFNVLCRSYMENVFIAMSDLLKKPFDDDDNETAPSAEDGAAGAEDGRQQKQPETWSGLVKLSKKGNLEVSIQFGSQTFAVDQLVLFFADPQRSHVPPSLAITIRQSP